MQNSGLGNAVNPLLSLVDPLVYKIPILMIIGWRGEPSIHDEPQHIKQGQVTLSLLDTMSINYEILNDNYKNQLEIAKDSFRQGKSFALVVKKGTFSPFSLEILPPAIRPSREAVLEEIIANINDDYLVSTTGKSSREIFEIRERRHEDHSHDFLTVGSMGHTASIAYGIASNTSKNVFCFDGDGSFIMHMGSLAVIGSRLVDNFKYILNDNSAHESVGGQPTCTPYIDTLGILKSCGFKKVYEVNSLQQLKDCFKEFKKTPKAALIIHTRQGSRSNLGRPTSSPEENKIAFCINLQR
jgi:phosphonopyruvate decarboxylase